MEVYLSLLPKRTCLCSREAPLSCLVDPPGNLEQWMKEGAPGSVKIFALREAPCELW